MKIDDSPVSTLADMQASLDRADADVAAGRIVAASEVHARLQRAITVAKPQQHETHRAR